VTWTDENSWSLQLPLRPGAVSYTLEALRKNGAIAGSATFNINASGATFPAGPNDLIPTEVHYNPPGPTDATEFIEIMNITGSSLDLSGCHFDDDGQGIAYTFPNGTTLAAGARRVIARDVAAFTAAYPTAGAPLGPYIGALDNGGETITLYAASGAEIFRFTYADNTAGTDGNGLSLVRVLGAAPIDPAIYVWRASTASGGNPGSSDALVFSGDPLADADGDGHSALLEYAFGTSDAVFNAPELFLTPSGGVDPPVYTPLPNADAVILSLESSSDLVNWTAGVSPDRGYWRLRATRR
jgi:Lamin Tail Domain